MSYRQSGNFISHITQIFLTIFRKKTEKCICKFLTLRRDSPQNQTYGISRLTIWKMPQNECCLNLLEIITLYRQSIHPYRFDFFDLYRRNSIVSLYLQVYGTFHDDFWEALIAQFPWHRVVYICLQTTVSLPIPIQYERQIISKVLPSLCFPVSLPEVYMPYYTPKMCASTICVTCYGNYTMPLRTRETILRGSFWGQRRNDALQKALGGVLSDYFPNMSHLNLDVNAPRQDLVEMWKSERITSIAIFNSRPFFPDDVMDFISKLHFPNVTELMLDHPMYYWEKVRCLKYFPRTEKVTFSMRPDVIMDGFIQIRDMLYVMLLHRPYAIPKELIRMLAPVLH